MPIIDSPSLSASTPSARRSWAVAGVCLAGVLLVASAGGRQATLDAMRYLSLSAEEAEILGHLSLVYLDDGQGGLAKTIEISGVNLRVHDGGRPGAGLGNVIVGYNEAGNPWGDDRTGSSNLVVGHGHSFPIDGGLVAGQDSTVAGVSATVSAGCRNRSLGAYSAVTGGRDNGALNGHGSISGGHANRVQGYPGWSGGSVSGGYANVAALGSVAGGSRNGSQAQVSGGIKNRALGGSVSGGHGNHVLNGSVTGGYGNRAVNLPWGDASVGGGRLNECTGLYSALSGGRGRSVTGQNDWGAGALLQDH